MNRIQKIARWFFFTPHELRLLQDLLATRTSTDERALKMTIEIDRARITERRGESNAR